MLNADVRDLAGRCVLCWMATVDAGGEPNVSPKEVWRILDDRHVVIANIASPTTARNIVATGKACLALIDIFVQKGFKVSGPCRNLPPDDPDFVMFAAPLLPLAGPRFPLRSVFVLEAARVQAIIAPSYRLYPDEVTEAVQIEAAMRTYGVRPDAPGA